MASKKAGSSTTNGRDSRPKMRGVKLFGGEYASTGSIIVRQKGSKWKSGVGTFMGKDFTIHAQVDGVVEFIRGVGNRVFVCIKPF